MNQVLKANLAVLTANVLYGINYIAAKEAVAHLHPFGLAVYRAIGPLLLLLLLHKALPAQKVEPRDYWKLAIAGLIGVSINQTLLVAGLLYTSSSNASIIMTSNPILVLLISAIFLKYKITLRKSIGIVIGISGALIVILSKGKISFAEDSFKGDLLIATNGLMYAIYLAWINPLMKKYDPITVMRWMFIFGSVFIVLFGGQKALNAEYHTFSAGTWAAIGFVVIGATFFTYFLNIYGLKHISPTSVSVYIYIQPVIASGLALFLNMEKFSAIKLFAFILVATGVYLANMPEKKKQH